jgi:hypothetical protein
LENVGVLEEKPPSVTVLLLVGVDGMAALEDRRSFFEKAVEV